MNWKAGTGLFFLGYVIASVVGYALYRMSPTAMWVGMFTLMPAIFSYLAFVYFNKHVKSPSGSSAIKLAIHWVVLSFVLDALVYILLLPIAFGAKPNWLFFVDQSPWIWLAYASLAITIAIGLVASRACVQRGTANDQVQRNVPR